MTSYHVLIVDDHSEVRRTIKSGIESLNQNINILEVPSGEEAILVLSQQKIDLLIADARLPGISGIELKKRVKADNPDLKIFLITGVQEPKIRHEVFNAGADAYFFKPIQMAGFLEAVTMSLNLDQILVTESQEELSSEDASDPYNEIATRLYRLHQELNANYTAILNEGGQILVQVGVLPEDASDPNLLSSYLATLKAAAKISQHLNTELPKDFMVFSGPSSEFLLTHIGQLFGLLVVVEIPTWNEKNFWKVFLSIRSALQDFLIVLSEQGIPLVAETVESPVTPDLETEVEIDSENPFLYIDKMLSKMKNKTEAANKFWEMATERNSEDILQSDVISFDQARKLGLTPMQDDTRQSDSSFEESLLD